MIEVHAIVMYLMNTSAKLETNRRHQLKKHYFEKNVRNFYRNFPKHVNEVLFSYSFVKLR